jgi:hypothetical protein
MAQNKNESLLEKLGPFASFRFPDEPPIGMSDHPRKSETSLCRPARFHPPAELARVCQEASLRTSIGDEFWSLQHLRASADLAWKGARHCFDRLVPAWKEIQQRLSLQARVPAGSLCISPMRRHTEQPTLTNASWTARPVLPPNSQTSLASADVTSSNSVI